MQFCSPTLETNLNLHNINRFDGKLQFWKNEVTPSSKHLPLKLCSSTWCLCAHACVHVSSESSGQWVTQEVQPKWQHQTQHRHIVEHILPSRTPCGGLQTCLSLSVHILASPPGRLVLIIFANTQKTILWLKRWARLCYFWHVFFCFVFWGAIGLTPFLCKTNTAQFWTSLCWHKLWDENSK